jgi:hypothetical protein
MARLYINTPWLIEFDFPFCFNHQSFIVLYQNWWGGMRQREANKKQKHAIVQTTNWCFGYMGNRKELTTK